MTGDFWTRRKAAVEAEAMAAEQLDQDRAVQAERAALQDRPDAEILAELDLPDPDTLQPGDGIGGFMAQAVPERIRRRALRRLWLLNPALANVDGLVDYGEDFTDSATVLESLQTAYRVGKGFVTQALEDTPPAETATAVDPAEAPEMLVTNTAVPEVACVETDRDHETDMSAPAPRRMRFEFEG